MDEKCFDVGESSKSLHSKTIVEKRGTLVESNRRSNKKKSDSATIEGKSKCEYESVIIKSRKENKRRKEHGRKKEREAVYRRESRSEMAGEKEKENLQSETRMGIASGEEREDLIRREDHRQRLRKDGSSCSSYYSFSSTVELESDSEVQVKKGGSDEESSCRYTRDSKQSEDIEYYGEVGEKFKLNGDYGKEHDVVLRKQNTVGSSAGQISFEREKKSEKKFTDISIEDTESSKESLKEEVKFSEVRQSAYGKGSTSYRSYDGRKDKSSSAVKFNDETRQEHKQTGQVSLHESAMMYKQSKTMPKISDTRIETSAGCEKLCSERGEISTEKASFVKEARGEHREVSGILTREEKDKGSSRKMVSKVEETDVRRSSNSQRNSETLIAERKDNSTIVLSSSCGAKEQHDYTDQAARLMKETVKSQQLIKDDKEAICISQNQSKIRKQEDCSEFVSGSSTRQHSQLKATDIRRVQSLKGSMVDASNSADMSIIHHADSGKIDEDGMDKRISEVIVTPLVITNASLSESLSEFATKKSSNERLQSGAGELVGHTLDGGKARRDDINGRPLSLMSHDDALGSAYRLEKASMHHVDEFVENVNTIRKQEDYLNSVSDSYLEPTRQHTQAKGKNNRRVLSLQASQDLAAGSISADISTIHHAETSTICADGSNTRMPENTIRPSSPRFLVTDESLTESVSESATKMSCSEKLQSGSTELHGRTLDRSPALQHRTSGEDRRDDIDGQSSSLMSHRDALDSAYQLQKASAKYVDEFVENVRHEISSSEIQKERGTYETSLGCVDDQHDKDHSNPYVSGDPQLKDNDSRHSSQGSGTKGLSDEIWDLTREPTETEVQEDKSTHQNIVVRRTGKSLWNIIGDIFRLRWSSHAESHLSLKSGGKSSSNQSTSSETWFSGHEPEENVDENARKERKPTTPKSTSPHKQQRENIPARSQGDVSSSSSSKEDMKHVGVDTASASISLGIGSPSKSFLLATKQLVSGKDPVDAVSGTALAEPLPPSTALRLRRSPPVKGIPEVGQDIASGSGTGHQFPSALSGVRGPEDKDDLQQGKLKRTNQVQKDRFDEWEEACRLESEQRKIDEIFMREALLEAKKAADSWEVPIGAVLVLDGKIIARGYNLVEELRDSTAHAEMTCIREASKILRTWRLSETTLYITLEPCPMCAGAILQARIDTVVWGAPNKLLGADGSWIRLFPNGDGGSSLEQTDKPPAPVHPFHPKITIRRGVLASECADAMQQFFQLRRKKERKQEPPPSPPSCLPITNHPSKLITKMHDVFHMMFCL